MIFFGDEALIRNFCASSSFSEGDTERMVRLGFRFVVGRFVRGGRRGARFLRDDLGVMIWEEGFGVRVWRGAFVFKFWSELFGFRGRLREGDPASWRAMWL